MVYNATTVFYFGEDVKMCNVLNSKNQFSMKFLKDNYVLFKFCLWSKAFIWNQEYLSLSMGCMFEFK